MGIASDERQELNTQADRDALFARYTERTLSTTASAQAHIAALVEQHRRVAIMCFEHEVGCCHRNALSKAVVQRPDFHGQLTHL